MLGRCRLLAFPQLQISPASTQNLLPPWSWMHRDVLPRGAAVWERSHTGAVLGGWKRYRKMSTFVVEDGMCWVGESQHRNHQGKSFHPANAGIELPLSSPGLHNGALEWSNYCSVCELRLKSQQRWCLALAQGFALLTGSSAQAGTAVQLCCWWHWHSRWDRCGRMCLGDVSRSQQPGLQWPGPLLGSVSEALEPAGLSQSPRQTQVNGNVISKSVIPVLPQWDPILTPFTPLQLWKVSVIHLTYFILTFNSKAKSTGWGFPFY